jgi:hypothetical protein
MAKEGHALGSVTLSHIRARLGKAKRLLLEGAGLRSGYS